MILTGSNGIGLALKRDGDAYLLRVVAGKGPLTPIAGLTPHEYGLLLDWRNCTVAGIELSRQDGPLSIRFDGRYLGSWPWTEVYKAWEGERVART